MKTFLSRLLLNTNTLMKVKNKNIYSKANLFIQNFKNHSRDVIYEIILFVENKHQYRWFRAFRMSIYSILVIVPLKHLYYLQKDRSIALDAQLPHIIALELSKNDFIENKGLDKKAENKIRISNKFSYY